MEVRNSLTRRKIKEWAESSPAAQEILKEMSTERREKLFDQMASDLFLGVMLRDLGVLTGLMKKYADARIK